MLIVEQTLTCDICGVEIRKLKSPVEPGTAVQEIVRDANGFRGWKDVCWDCFHPLSKAFWAIKTAKADDER